MNYSEYKPHMDAEEGIRRVMGNLGLYLRLVGKFDAVQMVEDISSSLGNGDFENAVNLCHALRGTAANLSFTNILRIATEVEARVKDNKPAEDLLPDLRIAAAGLAESIKQFTASVS